MRIFHRTQVVDFEEICGAPSEQCTREAAIAPREFRGRERGAAVVESFQPALACPVFQGVCDPTGIAVGVDVFRYDLCNYSELEPISREYQNEHGQHE